MNTLTPADTRTADTINAALHRILEPDPWAFRLPGGAVVLLDREKTRILGPYLIQPGSMPYAYGGLALDLSMHHLQLSDINGALLPITNTGSGRLFSLIAACLTQLPDLPAVELLIRSPGYRITGDRLEALGPGRHALRLVTAQPSGMPFSAADPTFPHLKRWLSGLTFTDERYLGNLLGWIVASFARSAIREFPPLVLNGTNKSVGKSTVADAIRTLHGQSHLPHLTYTGEEQEFEIRLGAFAGNSPGPNIIQIENVRPKRGSTGEIRSQALSAAATSWTMPARKLYVGPSSVSLPVIVFTMNGAKLETDLADKVITVTLTRHSEKEQVTHLDPHPLLYVQDNRYELLREIQLLLSAIRLPAPAQTRLYDFERVARASAAALGLPCDFTPGVIEVTDVFLIELATLVEGEVIDADPLGPTYSKLVKEIAASKAELPELSSYLHTSHKGTERARVAHLRHRVRSDYLETTFPFNGAPHVFTESTDAHGVYHLRLDPAPATCSNPA